MPIRFQNMPYPAQETSLCYMGTTSGNRWFDRRVSPGGGGATSREALDKPRKGNEVHSGMTVRHTIRESQSTGKQ